ncbi:two-component regulator propeller domain-containing protein [Gracilimonas sp.]|uniref:ligand-binding sensor domain-containing protein n=1 Tax=Gracilimonas sp. TaxID=1974203 RepID=UPI0028718A5A|nr:two-component regulator propeller domain-containing protein [Gracilimonas sp.]
MFKRGFLLLILFCLGTNIYAFQFSFLPPQDTLTAKQWTLEDGLPVNTVGQIAQDSVGFIWISTYDGLVKFDGLNFEVFNYSNTSEMPHNRTTDVYFQNNDSLWVPLEYGGVMLFSNDQIQHFGSQEGFTDSDLTQIHTFSGNRMFLVTNAGLYVFEEGSFRKFYEGRTPGQNQVHSLYEDRDKTIWVATNNGLLHFSKTGQLIKEYKMKAISDDNRFLEVKRNTSGNIIVGTYHGLYELHEGQFHIPQKYEATDGYAIYTIYEDADITLLTSSS